MVYSASYRATACICATANTIPDIAHKPAGCGAASAIRRPERGLTSRPNSAKRNAEDLRRSRRIPWRYKLSPAHQTNQSKQLAKLTTAQAKPTHRTKHPRRRRGAKPSKRSDSHWNPYRIHSRSSTSPNSRSHSPQQTSVCGRAWRC